MNFTSILVGNGLGRSICNDDFLLEAGLRAVWESPLLDESTKKSIKKCIPQSKTSSAPEYPTSEEQLETLHKVVGACETLRAIEGAREKEGRGDLSWLSEHGDSFPINVQRYIAQVATYFHEIVPAREGDYKKFIDSLCRFIRRQNTHIATLNYDSLLYRPLVEEGIMDGYDGKLVDGFLNSGFSSENLERRSGRSFGWYLHLHGSPLFKEEDGVLKKSAESNLGYELACLPKLKRHVVLQHTKHKPEIISSSQLLASYWEHFGKALDESHRLIIFGYGGGDTHVNKKISNWISTAKIWGRAIQIYIVQREDSLSEATWKSLVDPQGHLKTNLVLLKKDNILKFRFDAELP